jgi:putative hemolysin
MEIISRQEFAAAMQLDKYKLNILASPLMKLMRLDELNRLYASVHTKSGLEFIDEVLDKLGIIIEIRDEDIAKIPGTGAFIALSNHPYGGIDGLIMLRLLAGERPEFKLMANFILTKLVNIEDFLIPVNPFENLRGSKINISGLKKTVDFLNHGYPVGIFPAGEVSSFGSNNHSKIMDKEWHPAVGRLILRSKLPILPVYFHGQNSYLFNILGLIHPKARTAKLPSELLNKKDTKVVVRIGKPVPFEEIIALKDNFQVLRYLRAKVYALGSSLEVERFFFPRPLHKKISGVNPEVPITLLEKEIDELREENRLFFHSCYEVFVAGAQKIPNILLEIGRLREISFREAGEGSNRKLDLDEFDLSYYHLFIWDSAVRKVVGAYRIGKGKELYLKYRKKGFYLHKLFRIRNEMVPILEMSLELGRAFVRREYQQKYLPLYLLWKGILFFLRNNPGYRYLIGPVSISRNFSDTSRSLMIKFIEKYYYDPVLAEYVEPRKEFRYTAREVDTDILIRVRGNSISSLDELISEIEPKHFRVPVLLKKYIKQNGKIIGFNLDPQFNESLDGFLILDVNNIPGETLEMLGDKNNS